jgi:phosphoribosylformylglycinamidine (FGAM) synthase PurS component
VGEQTEIKEEPSKGPIYVSLKEPYVKPEQIKNREGEIVSKRVQGVGVDEIRSMKIIEIELEKEVGKAYMDVITGSLYDRITGVCFSSDTLKIVAKKSAGKRK